MTSITENMKYFGKLIQSNYKIITFVMLIIFTILVIIYTEDLTSQILLGINGFILLVLGAISTYLYIFNKTLECKKNVDNKSLECIIKGSKENNIFGGTYNKIIGGIDSIDNEKKEKIKDLIRFMELESDKKPGDKDDENSLNQLLLSMNKDLVNCNSNYSREPNNDDVLISYAMPNYIIDTLNKYYFTVLHPTLIDDLTNLELIGFTYITNGHFTAYVKYNYLNTPQWFMMDTLKASRRPPRELITQEGIDKLINGDNKSNLSMYLYRYINSTELKNGTPKILKHFNNICYSAAALQLIMATDLLDDKADTLSSDKTNIDDDKPKAKTSSSDKTNIDDDKPKAKTSLSDKTNIDDDKPKAKTSSSDKTNIDDDKPKVDTSSSDALVKIIDDEDKKNIDINIKDEKDAITTIIQLLGDTNILDKVTDENKIIDFDNIYDDESFDVDNIYDDESFEPYNLTSTLYKPLPYGSGKTKFDEYYKNLKSIEL